MKNKSKIKRITTTAGELAVLASIILVGGFILPIYLAPHLAAILPITTPYEAARQNMSVQIQNRNANHGETISVGVSNPASAVVINSISYSCEYSQVTLTYLDGGTPKEIPCDTELSLPDTNQHRLMPLTSKREVTYIPVEVSLENQGERGTLSVIIAVSATDADNLSRLGDSSTATLQSFPSN